MGKLYFGPHGKNEESKKKEALFDIQKALILTNMAMGHIVCEGQLLTLKIIFRPNW